MNGVALDYGTFVFTMNRLIDYVKFTVDHLKDFKFDFDYCGGMQSELENNIVESRNRVGGVTDIKDMAKLNSFGQLKTINPYTGKRITVAEYLEKELYKHPMFNDLDNQNNDTIRQPSDNQSDNR